MFNEWNFLGMDSADSECEWSNAFVGAFGVWGLTLGAVAFVSGRGVDGQYAGIAIHRQSSLCTEALLFKSQWCQVPPTRGPGLCAQMGSVWEVKQLPSPHPCGKAKRAKQRWISHLGFVYLQRQDSFFSSWIVNTCKVNIHIHIYKVPEAWD